MTFSQEEIHLIRKEYGDLELKNYVKKGEILIFPNTYRHKVNTHINKSERITLSYNLYYKTSWI